MTSLHFLFFKPFIQNLSPFLPVLRYFKIYLYQTLDTFSIFFLFDHIIKCFFFFFSLMTQTMFYIVPLRPSPPEYINKVRF